MNGQEEVQSSTVEEAHHTSTPDASSDEHQATPTSQVSSGHSNDLNEKPEHSNGQPHHQDQLNEKPAHDSTGEKPSEPAKVSPRALENGRVQRVYAGLRGRTEGVVTVLQAYRVKLTFAGIALLALACMLTPILVIEIKKSQKSDNWRGM